MKKFLFILIFGILLFFGAVAWWQTQTSAPNTQDLQKKLFTVTKGTSIREIADELAAQGLIKDPLAFSLLVKQLGLENKIQAGEFYLSASMTAREITDALQVGTFDLRVTIPEGKRAEEVAAILKEHFSSFDETWRGKLALHEGYLFPDTYSFGKDATIDTIITAMLNNFEKKFATLPTGQRTNLTKEQLVTIASLVEREARFQEDRPLVASVIFNRLEINMPLQIDATVQYALGYNTLEKTWWKKNLTLEDLKITSPYNTYANPGLPPHPIASPGLDVLTGVINAPDTDYLYYVSDSQGHNHYVKTFQEHAANIKKYGLEN